MKLPSGFGALSNAWRPVRGREAGLANRGRGGATVQQAVAANTSAAAARFFSPAFQVQAAGYGIAPRASDGAPIAAMGASGSGFGDLGWAQTAFCDKFDEALDTLGELVKRLDAANVHTSNAEQARTRWANENSLNPFNRTAVGVWNCTQRTAELAQLIGAANAELVSATTPANAVPIPPVVAEVAASANTDAAMAAKVPDAPPDITGTIKTVAIAAGVIAAVVVIGPIVWEAVSAAKMVRKARGR
jgi:hypothetical protein